MVDGSAANPVAIGQFPAGSVLGDIHHEVEAVVGNHLHHVLHAGLVLVGPAHGDGLRAVLVEILGRALAGVDGIAGLGQHECAVERMRLLLRAAAAYHHALVLAGDAVARGNHAVQERFLEAVAQASHLACRTHVNAQYRVGVLQAGEGELAGLHADMVDVEGTLVRLRVGRVEHDAGRRLDEVALEHFADEGERAARAEVALDDLHVAALRQVLDVEGSADVQLLGYGAAHLLYLAGRGEAQLLGGEDHRGVARVDTGKLDVLRDGILHNLALLRHCVELHFVCLCHELAHDDGVFLAHLLCHPEEALQLLVGVADVHGGSREDVRGTHQDGIAHLVDELLHVLHARQGTPAGLVDAELVEHGGELAAVLGTVDADGRRAEDRHALPVELHGEVVRYLSARGDNDAAGRLKVDDVEHPLKRQLVEVEAVAHVVVRRDGLRVVVYHDALVAELARGLYGVDRAPVELYAAADAVGAAAEHDDRLLVLVEVDVVAFRRVGHVEVVRQVGMLAGNRRDALHGGQDAELLPVGAHGKVLLLHVAGMHVQHAPCYLEIAEAKHLCLHEHFGRHVLNGIVALQLVLEVDDVLHPLDEPGVNLRQLLDALHAVALLQGLGEGEDAEVGGVSQLLVEVLEADMVVADEAVHALPYHPQALLQHLLEAASDAHDLAHRLHAGAYLAAYASELREVPSGNLADEVVQRGSNVGTVCRAHLAYLVEGVAQGYLRCHKGQRIARRLACEGRGAGQAGVDFYDAIVIRLGIEGELYVALAHDAQVANTFDGKLLKHLHLLVLEGACRRHHDALARMDAEGVEVLHRGHGEAVVAGVADALELYLLPPLQALLHEHLGREGEGALRYLAEGLLVGTDTAAQAAQRVGRADHDGIADAAGRRDGLLHRLAGMARRHLQPGLAHLAYEEVAVLGVHDGLHAGPQHLHAVFLQHAVLVESRTDIESRLSAPGQHDAVGSLLLDDLLYKIRRDGLEVYLVGNALTGLDGGDIGVDEHRVDALLAQGLQGLTAGIVKLACLTNLQGTAAKYENFLQIHKLIYHFIIYRLPF